MDEALRAFATVLAGVGILFVGLAIFKKFTDKLLVNRKFRMFFTRWVSRYRWGIFSGFFLGSLTLSISTVRAVFTYLLSVRSLSLRQALFPMSWTLMGTSVVYFLFALDLKTASVLCLAIGSLNFILSRKIQYGHWIGLIFALGLILFGMQLFQEGVIRSGQSLVAWNVWVNNSIETLQYTDPSLHEWQPTLPSSEGDQLSHSLTYELYESLHYWDDLYHNIIHFLKHSTSFLFFVGLVASALFSQLGGGFLALSLGGLNYLEFDQATWMFFGVMAGAGVMEGLRSWWLKGEAQKLSIYFSFLHFLAALLGMVMFQLELLLQLPLIKYLAQNLASTLPMQVAFVPLLLSLSAAVFTSLIHPFLPRLLAKYCPPADEEDIMKPKFINDQALAEPEFAVDLIALEEKDLFKRLPPYIDVLRKQVGETQEKVLSKERLHEAYQHVLKSLKEFIQDLMHENISAKTAEYLLGRLEVLNLLQAFETHLWELCHHYEEITNDSLKAEPSRLLANICEVMDVFLMTASDALENPNSENIELLHISSSGSGDQMKNLRQTYLGSEQALDDQGRNQLRWVLFHFENYIIATQRLALLLDKNH